MKENEPITSIFDLFLAEKIVTPTPRLFKSIKEHAKVDVETSTWTREQITKYVPEEQLSYQDLERLYEEAVKTYDELPNQLKIKFKQNLVQDWITDV